MSKLTLAAVETDIGTLFAKSISEVKKTGALLVKGLDLVTATVDKIAAVVMPLVRQLIPEYAAAADVAVAALNAFDIAVDKVSADMIATAAATPGAKVSLMLEVEADVLAAWKSGKTGLVNFESVI